MLVQSNEEIKAGHIYKFKKYVDWPDDVLKEDSSFVIGVVGADEVATILERLAGKREPSKRTVVIKRLQTGGTLEGIHLLFIGKNSAIDLPEWLSQAAGKPILCVTETEGNMPQGSMINFVQEQDRLRFDVSLTAAEINQIKLSAALLTVARQVYGAKS